MTNQTEEYSNCPRCLSPWKRDVGNVLYCLAQCGMTYYPAVQQPTIVRRQVMFCENILRYEDILFWFLDTKHCAYRMSDDKEETALPWLNFDIEAVKLKKYLLFS